MSSRHQRERVRAQATRLGYGDGHADEQEMEMSRRQFADAVLSLIDELDNKDSEVQRLKDELGGKPSAQAAAKLLAQYSQFSEEQLMNEKVKSHAHGEAMRHPEVAERGIEDEIEDALRTLNWWHAWH